MAARIQREISLLVISLIAAVISLPMAATVASAAIEAKALAPVTQMLKAPVRIALDSSGDNGFYVTDPRNGGVLKYDASGILVRFLKTSGVPQGIAVLGAGHVMGAGNLVVTMGAAVAIIDKVTGLEITRLPMTFGFADGVAIDDLGDIYVADVRKTEVVKFTAAGAFSLRFGTYGSNLEFGSVVNNGKFYTPNGIAFERVTGRIAVTDALAGNVKFFSKAGVPQGIFGGSDPSAAAGSYTAPMGVAFEYSGTTTEVLSRVYVVDSFQSQVQVVTSTGTHDAFIGMWGKENGKLMVPSDVVYDKVNKRLLVANGNGNIAIYGIDGGKNPSASSVAAAPELTVNQPLSIVDSSTLPLSGTVTSGASVSCSLNGVKAFPATVVGSAWTCTVSGLAAGANSIDVVARNGLSAEAKKSYMVTYAIGGPKLTVASVGAYVTQNPLPLSGTVDAGSTLQVCNPVATCNTVTFAGTTWNYSVDVLPGENNIKVIASNGTPTEATVKTIYDAAPPVLTLSTVPTGSMVARQVVNVSGAVDESNLESVTVDGQPVAVVNNRFSYPVVAKTSVLVVAKDLAGRSESRTINLSYDPSKVAVDFTSHADGAVVQTSSQTVTGTLSGNAALVKVNGEAVTVTNGAWSKSVTLVNDSTNKGVNTILVDADGSISKLTLVYDPASPAVAATTPAADKAVNTSSVQVAGVVATNVELASVVAGVETKQISNVPFTVPLNQQGVYPVVLKAKDQNLANQAVRNIIYDTTPPDLTVTPASGEVLTVSGTAEPGAVVKVLNLTTGQPIPTATVAYTNGSWTATLGASLQVDNIDISATDAAGNVTSKTTFVADGNINIAPTDLIVDKTDADVCMAIVVGTTVPTRYQVAHGDIGPLVGGHASPNGKIDVSDCILILKKASGLTVSW